MLTKWVSLFNFLFFVKASIIDIDCKLNLEPTNGRKPPECNFKDNSFELVKTISLNFDNSFTERFAFDGQPPIQKYFNIRKKYQTFKSEKFIVLTKPNPSKNRTVLVEFNHKPVPYRLLFYNDSYPHNIHYELNNKKIKKCLKKDYECLKEGNVEFNSTSHQEEKNPDNHLFLSWQNNAEKTRLRACTSKNVMTMSDKHAMIPIRYILLLNNQFNRVSFSINEMYFQSKKGASLISESNLIYLTSTEAIFFNILLKESKLIISLLDENSNVLSKINLVEFSNKAVWKPIFLFAQSNKTSPQPYKIRIRGNEWNIAHTDITDTEIMNPIFIVKLKNNDRNFESRSGQKKKVYDNFSDNMFCHKTTQDRYGSNRNFSVNAVNGTYNIHFSNIYITEIKKISNNAAIMQFCSKPIEHKSNKYYSFVIKVFFNNGTQIIQKTTIVPYFNKNVDNKDNQCYADLIYGLEAGFFYHWTISSLYHNEAKVQHYF